MDVVTVIIIVCLTVLSNLYEIQISFTHFLLLLLLLSTF